MSAPPAPRPAGRRPNPLAALDQLAADGAAAGPDQDLTFASTLRGDGSGQALGEVNRTIESAGQRAGKPGEPPAMLPSRPLVVAPGSEAAAEGARVKAELAKAESAKAEAAKAEAAKAESAKAEAAKAELAKAEAAKAELARQKAAKELAKAEAARAEVAAQPAGEPRFTLHLLSFEQRAEADELAGRLRGAGYQPYVVETPEEGKGSMFRVRVGHFASFDEAVAGKADFEKKQNIIAYVTRTRK